MVATTTRGRIRHAVSIDSDIELGDLIGAENAHAVKKLLREVDADGVLRLTREQIAHVLKVPMGTAKDRIYALRDLGVISVDANTGRGIDWRFNTALPLVREWLNSQPLHSDDRFTLHRERFSKVCDSIPQGSAESDAPRAQHSYSAGARSQSPARAPKQQQQGQAVGVDFENQGAGEQPTSDQELTLEHVRDPERRAIADRLHNECGVWEWKSALLAMQHHAEWIARCIGNWKQEGGRAKWRDVKYARGPWLLIRFIEDARKRERWEKENERAWTAAAAWQAAGDDRQREADQVERDRLRRVECQRIIAAMPDDALNAMCDRVLEALLNPEHRAQLQRANRRGLLWMLELIAELVPVEACPIPGEVQS